MSENGDIEKALPGWEEAVVMVCSNCGKKLANETLKESPERIKSELKAVVKANFGKKIRVVTSSCLNICPEEKIAIVVASKIGPDVFKSFVVKPTISSEELYKKIIETKN